MLTGSYPLSAAHYISMLEWITIYSSVRIHFHVSSRSSNRYLVTVWSCAAVQVITNEESQDYVDQVMEKVSSSLMHTATLQATAAAWVSSMVITAARRPVVHQT